MSPTKEVIAFGGAKAVVWRRGDGRWAISWQEHGKGRATTIKRKVARARKIVRDIASGLGSRRVTVDEAEVLQVLYRVPISHRAAA